MLNRCRWLFNHSEYTAQHELAEQAIALAESHGLDGLAMEAQLWLGKGLTWEGKHDEARAALDASLAAARRANRRSVIADSLRYLAIIAGNVSEFALAARLLEETIAIHIADGDRQGEATVLVQMASVLYNEGHFAAARERLEQALPILVSTGFRYHEAVVVSNLAAIVVQQGELGHGRRLINRGLVLCQEIDDLEGVATAYNIRGEIERRVGDLDGAETDLRATLADDRSTRVRRGVERLVGGRGPGAVCPRAARRGGGDRRRVDPARRGRGLADVGRPGPPRQRLRRHRAG